MEQALASVIGGVLAYRIVQRLRARAFNPDMQDPGKTIILALPWLFALLLTATSVVTVAVGSRLSTVDAILAIVVAILCGVALVVASVAFTAFLWLFAEEHRRSSGYLICEAHYTEAPRTVKLSLRRITKAAASIRAIGAHRAGMFDGVDIDRLVFDAAQHAMLSSELSAAVRDLRSSANASDRTALADANAQLKAIHHQLSETEKTLKVSAKGASRLSERMAAPERERAVAAEAEAAAAEDEIRRASTRARLANAAAAADAKDRLDATDIADRIESVAVGYDEVTQVTESVLEGPKLPPSNDEPKAGLKQLAAESARTAAAASGRKAAQLGSTAAKAGLAKLKELRDNR